MKRCTSSDARHRQRNTCVLFQLSLLFEPAAYRRRSFEMGCEPTDFQKRVYLAMPSVGQLRDESASWEQQQQERRLLAVQQGQQAKRQHEKPANNRPSPQVMQRIVEMAEAHPPKPHKKLTSRDQGYFREFQLELPLRKEKWEDSMDLKLLKSRQTAFGFKVTRCAQTKPRRIPSAVPQKNRRTSSQRASTAKLSV